MKNGGIMAAASIMAAGINSGSGGGKPKMTAANGENGYQR
jgi:hypothetical protein